jgi:hypothetical protein
VAGAVACSLFTDTSGFSGGGNGADASLSDGAPATLDASAGDAPYDGPADRAEAGGGKSAYESAVVADGPIAYFHFEETESAVCADQFATLSCVYSGAGIVHGVSGISGTGVRLSTTSDAVVVTPKSPDLSLPYTIELWMQLDAGSASPGQQLFRIEDFAPSRSGLRAELFMDTGGFRTEMWSSGVHLTYTLASGPLTGSAWHHVVVGYDPKTQTDFTYVDGTASSGGNVALDASARPVVSKPLTFGAWTGSLDELAIYDKALPPDRIVAHFAAR